MKSIISERKYRFEITIVRNVLNILKSHCSQTYLTLFQALSIPAHVIKIIHYLKSFPPCFPILHGPFHEELHFSVFLSAVLLWLPIYGGWQINEHVEWSFIQHGSETNKLGPSCTGNVKVEEMWEAVNKANLPRISRVWQCV